MGRWEVHQAGFTRLLGNLPSLTPRQRAHVQAALRPAIGFERVCAAHAAYQAFAREAGIAHTCVNLGRGERVRGAVNVQNVNPYHRHFRQWLARFYRVASRYLPNYLGWRWALEDQGIASPERLLRAALGVFQT